MEFLFGIILGAIAGVTADLLFRQKLLKLLLICKRWINIKRGLIDPIALKPAQLVTNGNTKFNWISLLGTGEYLILHKYMKNDLIPEYISLPKDLDEIRKIERNRLEKLEKISNGEIWNGVRYSLTDWEIHHHDKVTEQLGLKCKFLLTDYAAFHSLNSNLDVKNLVNDPAGNPTTIRDKYYSTFNPEVPNKYLCHSFGINLSVLSGVDNFITFVQRNAKVAKGKKWFSIAMNEGMQYPNDLDENNKPSFVKTAIRGLIEELGINISQVGLNEKDIEFLNFGARFDENEYAILGCIKLPLTFREIEHAFINSAKDRGHETRHTLYYCNFTIPDIVNFVNSHSPWSHHGLATVYYTMIRYWGYWEVKKELSISGFIPEVLAN